MRQKLTILFCLLAHLGFAQVLPTGTGRAVLEPDAVDSLFYWFDAQDQGTVNTNNNKVLQWLDKSGNGYDVNQADTSKAPTYSTTAGPNGNTAALVFDGTDDFLASTSHWWESDDITVFVVMKFANSTRDAVEIIIGHHEASTHERQWYIAGHNTANSYERHFLAIETGTGTVSDGWFGGAKQANYALWSFSYDITSAQHYIDGAAVTTTLVNIDDDAEIFDASTPLCIGAVNVTSTPVAFLQGSISEIIVYSRALTPTEREGVEAYLSEKYQLRLENRPPPPTTTRIIQPTGVDSLFYWFDATDTSTLQDSVGGSISTGERVSSWGDKSGNGYDVTQATEADMPIYHATSGPNSQGTITFDGTSDFLASASHWWGSDDLTVFVVYKVTDALRDANEALFSKNKATGNLRQFIFYGGLSALDSYGLGAFIDANGNGTDYVSDTWGVKTSTFRVLSLIVNSTTFAWNNGVTETVSRDVLGSGDGSINDAINVLGVGCNRANDTPVLFLQGSISEIIVYSKALTPHERRLVEQYLNNKYNLY